MKNIILCGFMGCGKSTVGAALSKLLGLKLADLDSLIEARAGMPIPEIFAKKGEAHFRTLEHDAVAALAGTRDLVVASGGGIVQRRENVDLMKKSGVIVFLNVSFDTCYDRVRDSGRPLVKRLSREGLEQLYNDRIPLYRAAADIEIECADDPDETAKAIAASLYPERCESGIH